MSKPSAAISDDRQSRRNEVRLVAVIHLGAGQRVDAIAHNVSAHGVMVETDARFVPGRPVTIELAGLPRTPGRVAWVREGHAGLGFVNALTLDQLLAIV